MVRLLAVYLIGGAVFGYGYYRVIGCRSGQCMIGAHPYRSTFYGMFVGLLCFGAANFH